VNPKECILSALRRELPEKIPTFEWFIDRKVALALTGSDDPIEVVEQLDLDAVNLRPDYAKDFQSEDTYLDEWGITKKLTGDVLAASISHPIADITRQEEYRFPDPTAAHRFATLEKAFDRFGERRAVILNLRDGFSDMRDLLGYENALMAMALQPDHFKALLHRSVQYNLALARVAVERLGVQIVATTDDVCTANGPFISPPMYREIVAPAFRDVMRGYHDLGLLIIKHCDGDVLPLLDLWLEAGIDCLDPIDPGAGLDMQRMKAEYGDRIALKGNIDCTGHLCDGTPEQVQQEVKQCIDAGGPEGLIVSSSNTIHQGVRPDNYRAMIEAVRTFGNTR
jgi:uroporphyrinogen decarboxylase